MKIKKGVGILGIYLFLIIILNIDVFASQGFTVTSVSLTNILHPGEPETSVQWLVQLSLNGGGQSLVGTLDKSTINYQGITSAYPLQISGSTDSEKAFYIIDNSNPQSITKYHTETKTGSVTNYIVYISATAAPSCPSNTMSEQDITLTSGWLRLQDSVTVGRVCIISEQIGFATNIPATPNIQFSSHLNLMANSKSENLDLSYSQQSATSSSGLVQANWVGSLVTGNSPPDGSQYVAIGDASKSNWIVKSKTDYTQYQTSNVIFNSITYTQNTQPPQCSSIQAPTLTFGDFNQYISKYMVCLNNLIQNQYSLQNQYADSLLTSGINIGGSQTQLTNINGQKAFEIPISNYFVTNPVILLRFRGDFLGVVIPLGKPKITSATTDCFNSGEQGTIKLIVQNIGNAEGSFYPDLSDCKMISSQSPPKYSVAVGQSQNIEIPIFTTGTNTNLNQNCNIKVTDYNGGGSDISSLSICIKEANQCDPNKPIVQGKSICPCKNIDGTYKPATEDECTYCESGIVVDNSGNYICGNNHSSISGNEGSKQISSKIEKEILNYGLDQIGKAHIPIAIGPIKTEITLGSHTSKVSKISTIAFPNGATSIIKGLISFAGHSGCKYTATTVGSYVGSALGSSGAGVGAIPGAVVGGTVGNIIGTGCDSFIKNNFG